MKGYHRTIRHFGTITCQTVNSFDDTGKLKAKEAMLRMAPAYGSETVGPWGPTVCPER